MSLMRIVMLPSEVDRSPVSMTLAQEGAPDGWRKLHPDDPPAGGVWTVLIVPGTEVAAHWLQLPTRNQDDARAAARLQLEDELALEDDAAHLALGPLEADGYRLVAVASRSRMQQWIDLARRYRVEPDVMLPDHLALPEPADGATVTVPLPGGAMMVRGPRLAFACDADLLPLLLKQRPAIAMNAAAVETMMAEGARSPVVNLLQEEFAPRRNGWGKSVRLRWTVVLAALLLVSPALLILARSLQAHISAETLHAQSAALAATVLPAGTPIDDPVGQLQQLLRQRDLASGGPAGRLAHLYAALETMPGVQLESLSILADGALQASLRHGSGTDIDGLSVALRQNSVSLRVNASHQEGAQSVSDVTLEDAS